MILTALAIGILPVLLFLGALLLFDSYKLLHLRTVLAAIAAGVASGTVAWLVNSGFLMVVDVDPVLMRRYAAPLFEELLKAVYVIHLLRAKRIGFLIDASILGFAVGAGFSVAENLYYAGAMPDADLGVWLVRGLGTALMHGGATGLLAVIAKGRMRDTALPWLHGLAPGWLAAVVVHSLFNHFFLAPVLSALLMVVVLPVAMHLVMRRGERALRSWLGIGFDTDQELLQSLDDGVFLETAAGAYVHTLIDRFPPDVVFDMICMLRLHLELSIHAKGMLLLREAGIELDPDPDLAWKLREMQQLEKNIGRAGLLALQPCLSRSSADLWQLHLLRRP